MKSPSQIREKINILKVQYQEAIKNKHLAAQRRLKYKLNELLWVLSEPKI